jgi:hypothetical protein
MLNHPAKRLIEAVVIVDQRRAGGVQILKKTLGFHFEHTAAGAAGEQQASDVLQNDGQLETFGFVLAAVNLEPGDGCDLGGNFRWQAVKSDLYLRSRTLVLQGEIGTRVVCEARWRAR